MTHKGEKYSVKLKKYYFCNGTFNCALSIKVALAHPAASNGVCSRHRPKFRKRKQ